MRITLPIQTSAHLPKLSVVVAVLHFVGLYYQDPDLSQNPKDPYSSEVNKSECKLLNIFILDYFLFLPQKKNKTNY